MVKKKTVKHVSVRSRLRQEVRQELKREDEIRCVKRRLCIAEKLMHVLVFLAILGALVSLYLTWIAYSPAEKSFCSVSETVDCKVVAQSGYFFVGVPLSLFGLLAYVVFILVGLMLIKGKTVGPKEYHWALMVLAGIGVGFGIYMFYVQKFLLGVWCPLCIASCIILLCILGVLIASYEFCRRCRLKLERLGAHVDEKCR
ncbi:vitamin K epoxide reductase family protein, partial [Candidatus Woesearchaeota archaeon]|nr:vitamin K epoxide reductase family protein [Candidatus Woesearchaeota archaeon]